MYVSEQIHPGSTSENITFELFKTMSNEVFVS